VQIDGNRLELTLLPEKGASDVSKAAASASCVVTALSTRRQSLEDLFVAVVGKTDEEPPA
jgi:hypothetical protein